jgi:hypothetical protein
VSATPEISKIVHPQHQVDTGRHHRGRVDERRDGVGPAIGVGEPDVQWDLGGLPDRAGEQEQRDRGRVDFVSVLPAGRR